MHPNTVGYRMEKSTCRKTAGKGILCSRRNDSELQKADMPREKRIMESKEAGKKSKAADKTHEI